MPTGYDRLLATRFGAAAVRAVADERWGHMVALQSPHIVTIPIEEVLREPKRVDPKQYEIFEVYVVKNWPVRRIAKELGVSTGQVYVAKHRVSRLVEKEIKALEEKLV